MISKKVKYALEALLYLAEKYGSPQPILISDLAKKNRLPKKFLELILLEFKNKGLLASKKGKGGGYFLVNHPKKTTLAKAIRLVGGPIAMIPCVSLNFYEKCTDCDEKTCGLYRAMLQTRDATLKILEKKTLVELMDME